MRKLIAIAGLLALASGTAIASDYSGKEGDNDSSKEDGFQAIDRNQDGLVTWNEASADRNLIATFTTADVNADGYLTPVEFDTIQKEIEEME